MLRCCLKTLNQGLTDQEDIITWERESYSPLIKEQIKFVSPQNNTTYEIGETIATSSLSSGFTKNDIVVRKITTTTQQYRLKKVVNGIEVIPTEYKNNGEIYTGESSTASVILGEDSYQIDWIEQQKR